MDLGASEDLITILGESRGLRPSEVAVLRAIQFSESSPGGRADPKSLIRSCCNAAEPLLYELKHSGYNLWVFLRGASFTPEMKQKFSSYSLQSPLLRLGFNPSTMMERLFSASNGDRVAGIYELPFDNFFEICVFLTQNRWAIGVLSSRLDFHSVKNLTMLYESSKSDSIDNGVELNWLSIAKTICPVADLVVKTEGSFDDIDRELKLIYSAKSAPPCVLSYQKQKFGL